MEESKFVKRYPSWLQWYKKPSYVDIKEYTLKVNEGRASKTSLELGGATIPERLSLKRILANQTCSPMSLYDFYMYLKYIELSAENLEFYVWYKDYCSRYDKSQELFKRQSKSTHMYETTSKHKSEFVIYEGNQTGYSKFAEHMPGEHDPEDQYSDLLLNVESLLNLESACSAGVCAKETASDGFFRRFAKSITTKFSTPQPANPFDSPPTLAELETARKAELAAASALFLMPNSSKELNIPSAMRKNVLNNITVSTSPVHLKGVAEHCYQLLQSCSHRNFIRLGVSNGTFETVCMATSMGILLTILAFLAVILLALVQFPRKHSRWEVLGLWPLWFVGCGLILAGLRGSCFFFLLFSRRQPLPWERFNDNSSVSSKSTAMSKIVRKINLFDRKLKVEDVGLRFLQRKIAVQSLLGGGLFAALMVILFISLPIWDH